MADKCECGSLRHVTLGRCQDCGGSVRAVSMDALLSDEAIEAANEALYVCSEVNSERLVPDVETALRAAIRAATTGEHVIPDVLVAGGVRLADDSGFVATEDRDVQMTYAATERPAGAYSVRVEPTRLMVLLRSTESGLVARAPELNALGYGSTWEAALEDLADSIQQYLEFLRGIPQLAPSVAHHAAYTVLLDVPRGVWFASVSRAS